jgi:hypothetical protein
VHSLYGGAGHRTAGIPHPPPLLLHPDENWPAAPALRSDHAVRVRVRCFEEGVTARAAELFGVVDVPPIASPPHLLGERANVIRAKGCGDWTIEIIIGGESDRIVIRVILQLDGVTGLQCIRPAIGKRDL